MPQVHQFNRVLVMISVLCVASPSANADFIFSTIPDGVVAPSGSPIYFAYGGVGVPLGVKVGYRFVPNVSGGITRIGAWAYANFSSTSARFEIYSETSGLPGSLIGSALVTLPNHGLGGPLPSAPTPTFALDGSIQLTADQPYYCVLAPVLTTRVLWFTPNTLRPGVDITFCHKETASGPWWVDHNPPYAAALTIEVPTPLSGTTVMLGSAALLHRRRRVF